MGVSFQLQQVLLISTLICLMLGGIILGSLKYNPRLWLQDYPKPIREMVPPLSSKEKRERIVVAILVMGVLFGGVLIETLLLKASMGEQLTFGAAYLHIFLLFFIFNLFDALVLDLIILTWFTPKFVIIPGTEGMEYLFRDYRKQFNDFLKGLVFSIVASLPFALIAVI
jgi:hypothetical protein